MRKPTFHGYLDGFDNSIEVKQHMDGDRVINGADGFPLLYAKAKGFSLDWPYAGPRVVFEDVSETTAFVVLLDPEAGGDTFAPMEARDFEAYRDDGDDSQPAFEPRVGVSCCFTYDELTALIEGLQRVQLRMTNAKMAKEAARVVESFDRPREVGRVGNQPYKLPEVVNEAR